MSKIRANRKKNWHKGKCRKHRYLKTFFKPLLNKFSKRNKMNTKLFPVITTISPLNYKSINPFQNFLKVLNTNSRKYVSEIRANRKKKLARKYRYLNVRERERRHESVTRARKRVRIFEMILTADNARIMHSFKCILAGHYLAPVKPMRARRGGPWTSVHRSPSRFFHVSPSPSLL